MKTQLSGGLEPTKYKGRAKDARPSKRIALSWRVDIANLPSGIYFYTVNQNGASRLNDKLVILK
jgi:hypothetical protein